MEITATQPYAGSLTNLAGTGRLQQYAQLPDTIGAPYKTQVEEDRVQLSPEARQAYATAQQSIDTDATVSGDDTTDTAKNSSPYSAYEKNSESPTSGTDTSVDSLQLSAEAQKQLIELEQRDREVQIHEAAHAAVGGRYTGAPKLSYTTGPDGKRYATSGEVNVDMSEVPGDPAATIKKAETIHAAALAPAQPSAQDRNVAAKALQMKAKAQAELMQESAAASENILNNAMTPVQQSNDPQSALFKSSFSGAIA